jgi:2-C-methyl-D-erythritol 4-phosphate cytidylyltransferase
MKTGKVVAVIPAGGRGQRMGGPTPKQFLMLGEAPLLLHCLQVFERAMNVAQVILVVPEKDVSRTLSEVVERYGLKKVLKVIAGGATRQESVHHGLKASDPDAEIIVVHDAVRPFVTEDLIDRSIEVARNIGGAVVAVPMKETVKEVNTQDTVLRTIDRTHLWLAQTPQAFRRAVLVDAYRQAENEHVHATDDAALLERLGQTVGIVAGRWDNIKITSPEDMDLAEAILASRRNAAHVVTGTSA